MIDATRSKTLFCVLLALSFAAAPASEALAKKGGGGNGGGNAGSGNGGEPEPVYIAVEATGNLVDGEPVDLIDSDSIASTNLSFDGIAFRPGADFRVNLSAFDVSGPDCAADYFPSAQTGTLVLKLGDSASSCDVNAAELRFGFQGTLTDGKVVQHYLVMTGCMDGAWPPTGTDVTMLTLTSWYIEAENRKAQKSDCDGAGGADVAIGVSLE